MVGDIFYGMVMLNQLLICQLQFQGTNNGNP